MSSAHLETPLSRQFAQAPLPQSIVAQVASAAATVFALAAGVYLILFMGVDAIAYLFLLVTIFAGSVAQLFQPGTLPDATPDRFGQRTSMAS